MQLVVLLLLVAGLAFLVLGLITGSTPLVLASIAASLLAVGAIVRHRRRQEDGAVGTAPDEAQAPALATTTGEERARESAAVPAGQGTRPAGQDAVPAGHGAAPVAPIAVPPAHAAGPAASVTEPEGPASPRHLAVPEEPAGPKDPAVLQRPAESDVSADAEPAEANTDPPLRSRGDEPVWVIDGRPRYHLSGCAFLIGREPEPVPLRQAVEDGFTPCAMCDPDSALTAG